MIDYLKIWNTVIVKTLILIQKPNLIKGAFIRPVKILYLSLGTKEEKKNK